MENWGKTFIEQYTKEEKESLHLLVKEIFKQNMLVDLDQDLLGQICRIWWVVLGSFGNTALFRIVLNNEHFSQRICDDADIDCEIFTTAINELKNNDVEELSKREDDVWKYTMFLLFDMIGIFTNITGTDTSELLIKERPNPELLSRFYTKSNEIMAKGSNTWRNAISLGWNEAFKEVSSELDRLYKKNYL